MVRKLKAGDVVVRREDGHRWRVLGVEPNSGVRLKPLFECETEVVITGPWQQWRYTCYVELGSALMQEDEDVSTG